MKAISSTVPETFSRMQDESDVCETCSNKSKLLEEANQVIDDLKSQIFTLQESIKVKDKWLADFQQILIA